MFADLVEEFGYDNKNEFTQGLDPNYKYELGSNFVVLKYKFLDDYNVDMKLIPIMIVQGGAFMSEDLPIYEEALHDDHKRPGTAYNHLMKKMRDLSEMVVVKITAN